MGYILPENFHMDEGVDLIHAKSTKIELIPVKRRRRGILFAYHNFQYLYEIDTSIESCWELDCDVNLIDKRPVSEVDKMDENQITYDGFMLVEIVETAQGCVLSLLLHLMDVDVHYWVERDLTFVIYRIFKWYDNHMGIVEGGSGFLSGN